MAASALAQAKPATSEQSWAHLAGNKSFTPKDILLCIIATQNVCYGAAWVLGNTPGLLIPQGLSVTPSIENLPTSNEQKGIHLS